LRHIIYIMMKKKVILQYLAVLAVCAGAFFILREFGSAAESAKPKQTGKVRMVADAPVKAAGIGVAKATGRSRLRKASAIAVEERVKPNIVTLDDDEDKELTDLAKKVLASLQAALDSNDLEQIRAILASVKDSPKGSLSRLVDGMPVALRKRLVEALGWFGNAAIPDMMEFLADTDAEVAQMTADQFQLALEDISLGDRERADIVTAASQVITDEGFLEMFFMEISNMRNSVAAQTLVDICQTGTEEAKQIIPETIEFVTGEDNIETVEDIERWLDENPDGPDDDDLYGPMPIE